jgi:hypothetical protein
MKEKIMLHNMPSNYTKKIRAGLRELRGHFRNLMGTRWEQTQKKIPPTSPPPFPPPKTRKVKKLCHPEPSHWLHGISISKKGWSSFSTWTNTPIIYWWALVAPVNNLSCD